MHNSPSCCIAHFQLSLQLFACRARWLHAHQKHAVEPLREGQEGVCKDSPFEREEMVSATVAGVTKLGRMPMEIVTSSPPTLGATKILTSHFINVLQAPLDRAKALWKIATEVRGISHRIVNLVLSPCFAHIKSFCEIGRALCTSQKKHAKLLLQPPSESGDRSKKVVLPPDLPFPLRRSYRHLFRLNASEP